MIQCTASVGSVVSHDIHIVSLPWFSKQNLLFLKGFRFVRRRIKSNKCNFTRSCPTCIWTVIIELRHISDLCCQTWKHDFNLKYPKTYLSSFSFIEYWLLTKLHLLLRFVLGWNKLVLTCVYMSSTGILISSVCTDIVLWLSDLLWCFMQKSKICINLLVSVSFIDASMTWYSGNDNILNFLWRVLFLISFKFSMHVPFDSSWPLFGLYAQDFVARPFF